MRNYVAKRIAIAAGTLVFASIVIFAVMRIAPGDPALTILGPDADPEALEALRIQLGLHGSVLDQYFTWLRDLFTGELGQSYSLRQPIEQVIAQRIGGTLELALVALVLKIVVGTVLGIVSAGTRSGWLRNAIDVFTTALLSMPAFVSAVLLIFIFAVFWRLLPSGGQVSLLEDPVIGIQYLILPGVAIALPGAAVVCRLLATEMRRNLEEEYVRTATSKGAGRVRVLLVHVVPNSLGPALVQVGIGIGDILAGALVAELMFSRAGMGALLVTAVTTRDYLLAQDLLLLIVGIALIIQLATEVLVSRIDRRVVLEGRAL